MLNNQRKLTSVSVNDIRPSPKNPRHLEEPDDELLALAASIKRLGILQPILVRQTGEILAGHRRFLAAKLAGLEKVPVIYVECADFQRPEIFIAENLHRQDLLPSEVAGLLNEMKQDLPMTRVAEMASISISSVRKYLSILRLPAKIWPLIDSGKLSLGAAEMIIENAAPESQVYLAGLVVSERLTLAQLRERIGLKPPGGKGTVRFNCPRDASDEEIVMFSLASFNEVTDRLRSTPRLMDYADDVDELAERLRATLQKSDNPERILLTAESEDELQAKRVKAERQGFTALGDIQINHETDEVYIRMTKTIRTAEEARV